MANTNITGDEGFEYDIMAAMIQDRGLMEGFKPILKEEFLSVDKLQHFWALVRDFHDSYNMAPSIQVMRDRVCLTYGGGDKELRQRETLLATVHEVYTRERVPIDYVRDRLKTFLKGKALQSAVVDTLGDLQVGNITEAILKRFEDAIRVGEVRFDPGLKASDTPTVIRRECDPTWKPAISTGLLHLDLELGGGGLRPGELGILMAPPKGFKSGTLMNFALNGVKHGTDVNVLYLTLELSEHLQLLRLALRTTMVGKHQMFADPEASIDLWQKRVVNIYSPGKNVYIKYFPPFSCTPGTIRRYLDTMKKDYGIEFGLICIDYVNLLGADEKKEKDYLERVAVATELRSIANDYNTPVWTAARANREEHGAKRPTMAHIASSYEMIAIADYCYALRRFPHEGTLHLIPIASRNEGGGRRVICRCDPAYMYLSSIGTEEREDENSSESEADGGEKAKKRKESRDKRRQEDDLMEDTTRQLRALHMKNKKP